MSKSSSRTREWKLSTNGFTHGTATASTPAAQTPPAGWPTGDLLLSKQALLLRRRWHGRVFARRILSLRRAAAPERPRRAAPADHPRETLAFRLWRVRAAAVELLVAGHQVGSLRAQPVHEH